MTAATSEDGIVLDAMHEVRAEMLAILDVFHQQLLALEQFHVVTVVLGRIDHLLAVSFQRARTGRRVSSCALVEASLPERKMRQLLNLVQRLQMLLYFREDVLDAPFFVSESN